MVVRGGACKPDVVADGYVLRAGEEIVVGFEGGIGSDEDVAGTAGNVITGTSANQDVVVRSIGEVLTRVSAYSDIILCGIRIRT